MRDQHFQNAKNSSYRANYCIYIHGHFFAIYIKQISDPDKTSPRLQHLENFRKQSPRNNAQAVIHTGQTKTQ